MEVVGYQLNDIVKGRVIGGRHSQNYILIACPKCGGVRWVRYGKCKPRSLLCRSCAMSSRLITDTMKHNMSLAAIGRPAPPNAYKKGHQNTPEVNAIRSAHVKAAWYAKMLLANPDWKPRKPRLKAGSPEHKAMLSEIRKGTHWTEQQRQRFMAHPNNINKVFSDETRRKISEAKKGFKHSDETKLKLAQYIGELASNWRGGTCKIIYPHIFRSPLKFRIRERDNFICQICFRPEDERAHSVHHIDGTKTKCTDDNLVTVCHNCHGKLRNNVEFWKAYFTKLLKARKCV